jgi:hypothetical protein
MVLRANRFCIISATSLMSMILNPVLWHVTNLEYVQGFQASIFFSDGEPIVHHSVLNPICGAILKY